MSVHKDIKNKTKDGRMWYFVSSYVDQNGNRKLYKSRKYKTQFEAKEQEALYLLKDNQSKYIKFSLIANEYFINLEKTIKNSTIESYKGDYKRHIKDFFGHMNIYSINSAFVRKWHDSMENKDNLHVSTLNKVNTILKNIFNYAMKYYDLPNNYAKIVGNFQTKNGEIKKDKDKIRYITLEEFNQFIEIADNELYKVFFTFLFYTGCRKGEAMALKWTDIDFNNKQIIIDKTLYTKIKGGFSETSTKNNKNRRVKMSNTLYDSLISHKRKQKKYKDFNENWYVFGNTKYLSTTSIDRYKNLYIERSGITAITIHEFRHSHVSLLINEYVKSNTKIDTAKFFLMMSNRMGHTIEVMQKTYMHLLPEIQDEIVDLLDNL